MDTGLAMYQFKYSFIKNMWLPSPHEMKDCKVLMLKAIFVMHQIVLQNNLNYVELHVFNDLLDVYNYVYASLKVYNIKTEFVDLSGYANFINNYIPILYHMQDSFHKIINNISKKADDVQMSSPLSPLV